MLSVLVLETPDIWPLNPDSETGTADSTDFKDFEEVFGDDGTNLFVARLQDAANRNLFYPCNPRNL